MKTAVKQVKVSEYPTKMMIYLFITLAISMFLINTMFAQQQVITQEGEEIPLIESEQPEQQQDVTEQEPPQRIETDVDRDQEILVDEDIGDTYIELRRPEYGTLGRRDTGDVAFSLNFVRQQLMRSNRLIY